jgi:hypothetical protein
LNGWLSLGGRKDGSDCQNFHAESIVPELAEPETNVRSW